MISLAFPPGAPPHFLYIPRFLARAQPLIEFHAPARALGRHFYTLLYTRSYIKGLMYYWEGYIAKLKILLGDALELLPLSLSLSLALDGSSDRIRVGENVFPLGHLPTSG